MLLRSGSAERSWDGVPLSKLRAQDSSAFQTAVGGAGVGYDRGTLGPSHCVPFVNMRGQYLLSDSGLGQPTQAPGVLGRDALVSDSYGEHNEQ